MVGERSAGVSPVDDPERAPFESRFPSASAADVSADVLFEALADARRRFVVGYLLRRDEPVSMDALVERLAAWETDTPLDELSSADRTLASVSLRHTHLLKLTAAGIATYDDESRTVAPGPNVEAAGDHLALLAAQHSR